MTASSVPVNPPAQPYSMCSAVTAFSLTTLGCMGVGALGFKVFTPLNPMAGALLFGIGTISTVAGDILANRFTTNPELIRVVGGVSFFAGVAAFGSLALKAAGLATIGTLEIVSHTYVVIFVAVSLGTACWLIARSVVSVVSHIFEQIMDAMIP